MPWQTVKDGKGNSYRFWRQQKQSSRGVACVMMVANLVQRSELDESTVRTWFGQAEGSKNIGSSGVRDFEQTGSTKSPIVAVLSKVDSKGRIFVHPAPTVRREERCG